MLQNGGNDAAGDRWQGDFGLYKRRIKRKSCSFEGDPGNVRLSGGHSGWEGSGFYSLCRE